MTPFHCRACGNTDSKKVLGLGKTPLANALVAADQLDVPEETFDLELVFCPGCTLVQITETVPAEKLFREYLYFSSFSDTMLQHARKIAEQMVGSKSLNGDSLAIEIASNDGYLLQYYKNSGVPVLGIEPALNIARVAQEEHGIPTLAEFFSEQTAARLADDGKQADVIHANNVLAHVSDLNGFVRGLALLLKDDGVAVIEVPYVKDLIDRCEFDTIYHEHLSYFSLTSLDNLFKRHGLKIHDVERIPIHGGSLRIFAGNGSASERMDSVNQLLESEDAWGVSKLGFYEGFARRVEELKRALRDFVSGLKKQDRKLAAYGAAAKGSTLLNYFELGRETFDFVVDRSTYKQGRYMPGVRLPIYSPERLLEAMPSHVLLLTWNFADEILEQQTEYRRRGGKFIIPIPELRVV